MELSTSAPLLISPSCLVPTVFAGRLPQPTRLPPADGHAAFTALQVLFGRPTPRRASLPTSLSLIGSVAAAPPADPPRSPRVTHWSSIPCRPQTPWCGGWMRRLRLHSAGSTLPHLWPTGSSWGRPLDYGPVLLRKPFGPHLTVGALSSAVPSWRLQVHLGCVQLSPACPFRYLHTCHLRPARHYPRLWIRPPSSGGRRDFNPPDQCAAWRTRRPCPTTRRRTVRRTPRPPRVPRRTCPASGRA